MKTADPKDLNQLQWDTFLKVQKAIKNHRFTFVEINETEFGVEISLTMTKSDAPINQIESELNDQYYR